MNAEMAKQLLDACYLAKRARDLLPALPEGVLPSFIQYLDVIQKLEKRGVQAKVSDVSDALHLPRPGVTRTVKDMQAKGYLQKQVSAEDGRITFLIVTEKGRTLSRKYDENYFRELIPYLNGISEAEAGCTIRTIQKFYEIMAERSDSDEK